MNLFGMTILFVGFVWIWCIYISNASTSVWDEMLSKRPSLRLIRDTLPDRYMEFHLSLQSAEKLQKHIISKPLHHSQYPYQSVRDAWQEVLRVWESIAVSPNAQFLQADIATGARMLASHTMRRLEELRRYDTSPYRTTWLGTGQPKDPYDSHTVTFV